MWNIRLAPPTRALGLVLWLTGILVGTSGCATRFDVRLPTAQPFDAAIVLGCPSNDDGSPTLCQLGRALQASLLWRAGQVQYFIPSGAAVHSPYVEAEALAQIMVAAGIPADRIFLEPNALHTDENVYNGLQIARRMGWTRLAVLSDRGHSGFGCQFLTSYGSDCAALSVDRGAVKQRHAELATTLASLRAPVDRSFLPLAERERRQFVATGRRRPPSFLLYPSIAIMRSNGESWQPVAPAEAPILCYADRVARR